MIPHLASPSVCVIDDEEPEYAPIIEALMTLGLGCVHVRGRNGDPLPPKPFDALRLIFTDLHLGGNVGKAAASHTANVFKSVLSTSCGPVLVVIWSKYSSDPAGDTSLPPEDQPTEAELFKAELLCSEPKFKTRLAFIEMNKPKPADRPTGSDWIESLKHEIQRTLEQNSAFDVLWAWESLYRNTSIAVSEILTTLAEANPGDETSLNDRLKLIFRLLAHSQGGPDISRATVSRHLMMILSHIGLDAIETTSLSPALEPHSEWLAAELVDDDIKKQPQSKLNSMLLTSPVNPASALFIPGTIYQIIDNAAFSTASGFTADLLQQDCFNGKVKDPQKNPSYSDFKVRTDPIVLEITPACDYHQGNRRCATLLAGLLYPFDLKKKIHSKDACKTIPIIENRFVTPKVDVGFVFCARYRFTLPLGTQPEWLKPHLRLRDILTTDIRNWHATQASRVGYISL